MSLDTPFPQIDEDALKAESKAYTTTHGDLSASVSNIKSNVTTPLYTGSKPWTGGAADTCHDLIGGIGSDSGTLQSALSTASSAIDTYLKVVDAQRTIYNHAAALYKSVVNEGLDEHIDRQKQTELFKKYNKTATDAVDAVKTAAKAYAKSLDDAIQTAKKVPDRSLGGSPPSDDLTVKKNPSDLVDPNLFTMLFGSVIGSNRVSGVKFENDVLEELGFDKNTTLYEIKVPGKGTIRVIPDGDDDSTVLEIKNVNSQHLSRQLLGEIRVAQESGRTPVIVTDDRTKLSGPLKRLAEEGQVKIYQRTAPGEYTNAVTGDEMKADPENKGIVPKDPDNSTDKGTVGQSGEEGGDDGPLEMPEEPGGEPPELGPGEEVPEVPELPELPDIIDEIIP